MNCIYHTNCILTDFHGKSNRKRKKWGVSGKIVGSIQKECSEKSNITNVIDVAAVSADEA